MRAVLQFSRECNVRKTRFECQPTSSQAPELGRGVGTVPFVPGKLVFALLQPILYPHLNASRIGEVSLQRTRKRYYY